MIRTLKQAIFSLCKRLQVFEATASGSWRGKRLLILGYHGISQRDEHEWNSELYMPPAIFRERLALLREGGYHVLPLGDAIEQLYAGTLPPRSVVITFDDGFVDFYREAYPLLAEFDYPATVYLTTYHCDYNRPVFDVMCAYLLWKGRGHVISGDGLSDMPSLDLRTPQGRDRASVDIRRRAAVQRLSATQKDALAAELARRVDVDYDELLDARLLHIMRPEEIQFLSPKLIDVQLHTHRHRVPRDRARFAAEITHNRQRIGELTSQPHSGWHFCYPSGEYDPLFLPWLRELDITSATTTVPGLANPESDPLLLPRLMDATTLPLVAFEAWAAGTATWLPRRRYVREPDAAAVVSVGSSSS